MPEPHHDTAADTGTAPDTAAEAFVEIDTDVLIVGGGGAGLVSSMLLSRLGVDHLLVSALPTTSTLPKAHLLNQRTMEILDGVGLAETVYAHGTPPENMSHSAWYAGLAGPEPEFGRRIGRIECWGAGGRSPQWAAASPQRCTNLPQIRLEPLLRTRAEELAPGRVLFHHELTGFTQDADGVAATVRDHSSNTELRVRAGYMLACDGGRTVGRLLGVQLEGLRDLMRVASVHITSDLSAWARDPDVLIRWLLLPHTGSGATMVPMGPTRWGPDSEEWVVHVNYAADDPRGLDDAQVTADLRTALGLPDHTIEVHRITRWAIEGVVADRFREGRVFLLGDAAHRHPPTGGLGLNAAIQDADNLAWKLAMVVRGEASDDLLATYGPERRPVTARNVQRAVDNALNHLVAAEIVGITAESDAEGNWTRLRRLWSGLPEDDEYVRKVRLAIASQSMEFDEHNIEYGYTYSSDAVLPDGTPESDNPDPVRIYLPDARPGHPLPHAWIEDVPGARYSTHHLVRPDRLVLVAGEEGDAWYEAAEKLSATFPVAAVRLGHLDGDYLDVRSTWTRLRNHTARGAVLVRPDRVIAWRAPDAVPDPELRLAEALTRILAR